MTTMLHTHDGKPVAVKKFIPIGRTVVVQRLNASERSKGGVVIPQNARDRSAVDTPVAIVVAAGPDVQTAKEGTLVLGFMRDVIEKLRFEGDEYLVFQEQQLIGVLLPEVAERHRQLAEREEIPEKAQEMSGQAKRLISPTA